MRKTSKTMMVALVALAMSLGACNFGGPSVAPASSKSDVTSDPSSAQPGNSDVPSSAPVEPSSSNGGAEGVSSVDPSSKPVEPSSVPVEESSVQESSSSAPVVDDKKGWEDPKDYTLRDFLTVSPSNWNELTYQDNNDTEIMSRIGGGFFTFNYEFDDQGNPIPGAFTVDFDGAADLEDITADYAGDEKWGIPEDAENNLVWKITLRDDLKWDDGTPIKAEDFVYTMKQQEDPLFQNYRADSYYNGDTVIHNAQNYVKQGQSGWFPSKSVYSGVYDEANDADMVFHLAMPLEENDPYDGAVSYLYDYVAIQNEYEDYVATKGWAWLLNALWGCTVAQEQFDALEGNSLAAIKADPDLKAAWDALIGWWQTEPGEELDFFVTHYTYPEMDFEDVGIFVGDNDLEIILVLDKELPLLKDDGSLSYIAAYNMSSLPVVKKDLYEANKIAPAEGETLWKSKYNSSVATTASWGPYKLTSFEADKQFVLERNPNWYGYNMDEYKGQYQTDKIIVDIIPEYKTALLAFKAGDVQSIGIDVSVADDYKNSSQAVFTPSDFVGSLQLQSNVEKLAERSAPDHNKLMLKYVDFRKAISLAIDRDDYCKKNTTASLAGFGIFTTVHYYDVENAGAYRYTDVAKTVICETYGVDIDSYDSLDDAYAAVTGYNLDLARELLTQAYNDALAAGDITATDKVILTVGDSEDTEPGRRIFNYLNDAMKNLAVGTPLEGRFELEYEPNHGSKWANDFRDGGYDICTGGWTGAAWNPGYFLLAYLSPDYMYSKGWDTKNHKMTFNPYGDDSEEHTYTMGLLDWYDCLNGNSGCKYNWGKGKVDEEFRLGIIAALEKVILGVYYTVPLQYRFSATLVSYKIEYITRTYNTFMGYGGLRYITYNYDDVAWETVKGTFDYTK